MARTDANPPMPEFSTSYVLQEVDPKWLTSAVKPKQFLHIDQAECIMCEGCVDICPWKCIHMLSTGAIDESVNADKADTRFHTDISWLDSWHSFSFGEHYDPNNTHHGLLLVLNDDVVAPGGGFGTHPHRDM